MNKWFKIIKKRWKEPLFYYDLLLAILFRIWNKLAPKGIYVAHEKWDTLIILDACRYDLFENKIKKIDPQMIESLRKVRSLGSCTPEFLNKNFKNRTFNDIIYITGNSFVDMLVKDSFFKVISVWKFAWNKKYDTVLPKDMVIVTKEIRKKYRDKRLIVHFVQPHYPFVKDKNILNKVRKYKIESSKGKEFDFWNLLKQGLLNEKEVWKAYERNLDYVLPYALELAKYLNKKYGDKVVITSDHGNVIKPLLRLYGHPCNRHVKELVEVPWLEYPKTS